MFLIYSLEDKILLKPIDLDMKHDDKKMFYEDIVLEKMREKHIGKVILNHGIVVTIKKLVLKTNLIVEMEGVINVEYDLELIIFRPQIGDILYGKITHSDFHSVMVDCEIIKVKVPVTQLMKPNIIDENEMIWYWKYDNHKLYYDIGEEVRLKVIELTFKTSQEINKIFNSLDSGVISTEFTEQENKKMTTDMIIDVLGTFNQEGLGPLKWWR